MKNYYYNINSSPLFEYDVVDNFPQINNVRSGINIDYSYRIKESGKLHVKDMNGIITEYDVKENDIVFLMYSNTENYHEKKIIIIRDDRFDEYFRDLDKRDKEREKRMNTEADICIDCEGVNDNSK